MATKIDKSPSGGISSIVHDDVSPGAVEIDMGKLEDALSSRAAYGIASDLGSLVLSTPSLVTVESIDEKIDEAISKRVKDVPYTDSFYAHLERAKEECLRKRIEADTVVIDRGIAVAEGVGHLTMVLGLRVKYAKSGSLPMGAAFVMLKAKADAGLEPTPEEDEAWKEKEEAEREKAAVSKEKEVIIKRGDAKMSDPLSMFIYYTESSGASAMVNVCHVVNAEDKYAADAPGGKKEWRSLALTTDVSHGSSPHVIYIRNKEEAKNAWMALLYASRYKSS